MKLVYKKKEIQLTECTTFFSRLKGFMFERNINKALLFNKCNSIHTFFMKEAIDVIFCDEDNDECLFAGCCCSRYLGRW